MAVQGDFDLFFTKIVTALETYSAAQVATERFETCPDRLSTLTPGNGGAFVLPYFAGLTPTEQYGQAHFAYDSTYFIDLIVFGKGTQGTSYSSADKAAGVRLRILIQQVLTALFPTGSRSLGMTNELSSKNLASVAPIPPERLEQYGERAMNGARMTLTAGMCWEPTALTGTPLDSISITADKWSALIEP